MFVETVEVGVALWHEKNAIEDFVTRIINRIRHGHLKIAIFGEGGTGKSTLGALFAGQISVGEAPESYKESLSIEKYKLKGNLVCTLIVPPGQARRAQHDWPELYRSLASGESAGIINVVANGYHSFQGLSFKELALYEEGMSELDFMRVYLLDRQKKELEALNEIVPAVKHAEGRVWAVTLVNKQDLWWAERKTVRQHYGEGEYNHKIDSILSHKGTENFRHEYLSASLVVSNFRTYNGEVLALTAEGYDQALRLANLNYFIKSVTALAIS